MMSARSRPADDGGPSQPGPALRETETPGGTPAAVYAGFLLSGVATVLLGPVIPEMRPVWGVDHVTVAGLFVTQFLASSVGSTISSLHLRYSLLAGHGAVAAGLAWLAVAGWPGALGAVAVVGLGLGLVIPATNLLVGLQHPGRRGAALSIANLMWGVGAVTCPLLFAGLRGHAPPAAGIAALAGLATLAGLWIAATPPDRLRRVLRRPPAAAAGSFDPSRRAGVTRTADPAAPPTGAAFLPVVAGMLFLYVGVESSVGGWLVALADQLGERDALSMLVASGFWSALLAGRAATPLLLRRLREPTLYGAALALAGLGTAGVLVGGSRAAVAAAALCAGAGLAPLFPLTVSTLVAGTGIAGSRRTGWVFTLGGLGGACIPWLTARLAERSGALIDGFAVPLAAIVVLAAAHGSRRLWGPSSDDRTSGAPC